MESSLGERKVRGSITQFVAYFFFLSFLLESAFRTHYLYHSVDSNDVGWQIWCALNSTLDTINGTCS